MLQAAYTNIKHTILLSHNPGSASRVLGLKETWRPAFDASLSPVGHPTRQNTSLLVWYLLQVISKMRL